MNKPVNDSEKLSITQLAKRYGRDRETIRQLVKDIPFVIGPRGAHLFDLNLASAAIESKVSNREGIVAEKLRQLKAQNELLEIELGKQKRSLIPAEEVYKLLENIFVAVKMKILGSSLSEVEQDRILNDLASLRDTDL